MTRGKAHSKSQDKWEEARQMACALKLEDSVMAVMAVMPVIGSSMGFPSPSDLLSYSMFRIALVSLLVSAAAWLIVDYARMLRLHKKMVCPDL